MLQIQNLFVVAAVANGIKTPTAPTYERIHYSTDFRYGQREREVTRVAAAAAAVVCVTKQKLADSSGNPEAVVSSLFLLGSTKYNNPLSDKVGNGIIYIIDHAKSRTSPPPPGRQELCLVVNIFSPSHKHVPPDTVIKQKGVLLVARHSQNIYIALLQVAQAV